MKILYIILKSIKEHMRQFWLLLLTVSMAPFFILVYYLITESSKTSYDLIVINHDRGVQVQDSRINHGEILLQLAELAKTDPQSFPLKVRTMTQREAAERRIKNNQADALIVIPENFSQRIRSISENNGGQESVSIEIIGDLTSYTYMITAVWTFEIIERYITEVSGKSSLLKVAETALGRSAKVDDFTYSVPGLLILSIVMLMFTASIAIVTEVENKTIIRLKLSRLTAVEYLSGISVVQILIGLISIILTLLVAVGLGFTYSGSMLLLILIALITSMSIIGFSLILAALTKTVNEVLVVGNFPLFLFMFFTGVAFPVKGSVLFNIFGYPLTLHGLMSPTHAVNALRKVMIMNMGFSDILPELVTLTILTILYFVFGIWSFSKRHMRVE